MKEVLPEVEKPKKRILLTRFGGIGDIAPVLITAKELKKRGWEVHVALREDDHGNKQIELIQNLDYIDFGFSFKEMKHNHERCVNCIDGWINIKCIYNSYNEVVDYMNIVEGNSTSPHSPVIEPCQEWRVSRNSNYVNWVDMHLAWANIDPTSVKDEDKRPEFKLSEEEIAWGKEFKGNHSHLFVISPQASSLARSWYQAHEMPEAILKEYPDALITLWSNADNNWGVFSKTGLKLMEKKFESGYRNSMAMIGQADCFIGVDTGFTHIAEGLNIKNIAIYSTVPHWTRAKYYKYQTAIDMGTENPEFYTFALIKGDPLNIREGMLSLTEREKNILGARMMRVPIEQVARSFNTTPNGIQMEFDSIMRKKESYEEMQSKSLTKVTVELVMNKIKEIL